MPYARWFASSRATRSRRSPRSSTPTQTFPWENVKKMGELGLLGVPWSEELGGAGLDLLSYMIAIHGARQGRRVHRLTDLRAHHARHVADRPLRHRRAEETLRAAPRDGQGARRLRPHRARRRNRRRRHAHDGGARRRTATCSTATKRFITHGGVGEIFVVTAVTDPSQGTNGISSFILTKDDERSRQGARSSASDTSRRLPAMPGFRAGKKEDKLGWRASDTARADHGGRRGAGREPARSRKGRGSSTSCSTLDAGRIGIAALSLGIAEGAYEEAVRYASDAQAVRQADRRVPGDLSSSSPTWRRRSRPAST